MQRNLKLFIVCMFVVAGLSAGTGSAVAGFPEKDVTLWTDHLAKGERKNPDYLKLYDLVGQNKLEEALQLIEQTHEKNPQKGTPLVLKSLLLYELKRYKEAYQSLQAGRDIQRRHPAIPLAHCRLYRVMGKVELSQKSCQIAVHQHDKSRDVHYDFAQTLAAMGNMERANTELARAAELDATNPIYHYERGMNFFYLNDLAQAEQAFLKALSINPDDPESGYQLGYLYTLKKKYADAEKYLNRIWQTRKDHPRVEASRKLIELIKTGDADKLPARTDPHPYHLNKSKKYYQEGEYGLSLFEVQTAARIKPDDKPTQQVLVAMASLLLQMDLTEKTVHQLIKSSPNDKTLQAKGYQELGDMRVMRGQLDQAREFYQKSEKLGDPDGLAKTSLAELPPTGADIKLGLNPNEVFYMPTDALNRKGEVFAHYGMYQRGLTLYALALRMNPGHLMSKLNMAVAFFKLGTYHKTITLLERVLVSHPDHEHILSHRVLLAKAYALKGNQDAALENLKVIRKLKPSALMLLKGDPAFKDLQDNELFKP